MKLLTPVFLIAISITTFYWFINPHYGEVGKLRESKSEHEAAVERAQQTGLKRDELVNRYNSFSSTDLERLRKFLPDTTDPLKLLVDVNAIAVKYGSGIKDIQVVEPKQQSGISQAAGPDQTTQTPYVTSELSFSVEMNYEKFLQFLADVERNLRLTDFGGMSFAPVDDKTAYNYIVTFKTYSLK